MSGAFTLTGERGLALPAVAPRGLWRRLLKRRSAQCGAALALLLAAAAIIGPYFLHHRPERINPAQKLQAPSFAHPLGAHPLGTDQFGRDQLARLLDGGRRSLGLAALPKRRDRRNGRRRDGSANAAAPVHKGIAQRFAPGASTEHHHHERRAVDRRSAADQ
jgi:hypothetical protein